MTKRELRDRERKEFLTTLRSVGPDAPTLCSKWTAADIAGHIVVSEQAYGLPMVVFSALRKVLPARVTRRGIESLQPAGDRLIGRVRRRGWDHLLRRLEAGPPAAYFRGALADLRLVEEWIHHEDVRRSHDPEPRTSSVDLDDALWDAGLTLMRFPEFLPGREGIEVARQDGRSRRLGPNPSVRVDGAPGELLLYLAGRTEVAQVTVDGDPSAVAALTGRLAV